MDSANRLAVIEGCYRRHPKVNFIFCPADSGNLPRIAVPPFDDTKDTARLRQLWGERRIQGNVVLQRWSELAGIGVIRANEELIIEEAFPFLVQSDNL